jgi:hypothetical protein
VENINDIEIVKCVTLLVYVARMCGIIDNMCNVHELITCILIMGERFTIIQVISDCGYNGDWIH